MSEVTRILEAVAQGDPRAADQLLPLVYDELRRLAAAKLAHEKPGHTLEATALVHEAYLRLVASASGVASAPREPQFDHRGHFFAAAAEAMRRILVESARRKKRLKHGGLQERVEFREDLIAVEKPLDELLAVDEALDRLADVDRQAAELVKLHYFAGLSVEEAAEALGFSARTAYRLWAFARAWLFRKLGDGDQAK